MIAPFIGARRLHVSPRTLVKYRHEWNCWKRYGKTSADDFRSAACDAGLSPKTIESVLSTVQLIYRHSNVSFDVGTKLRIPHPQPDVPTVEHIGVLYQHAGSATWRKAAWWRSFLAIASWTGFRHGDLGRFVWDGNSRIANTASKTGKRVDVPVPPFVKRHLKAINGQLELTTCRKHLYDDLRAIAKAARVPYVSPQGMRRFAIQQWSAADSRAGEIIHGRSLGVLNHYLDAHRHLANVAPRVEMPVEFLTAAERDQQRRAEQELVDLFRRSSKQKKDLIFNVVREIA